MKKLVAVISLIAMYSLAAKAQIKPEVVFLFGDSSPEKECKIPSSFSKLVFLTEEKFGIVNFCCYQMDSALMMESFEEKYKVKEGKLYLSSIRSAVKKLRSDEAPREGFKGVKDLKDVTLMDMEFKIDTCANNTVILVNANKKYKHYLYGVQDNENGSGFVRQLKSSNWWNKFMLP